MPADAIARYHDLLARGTVAEDSQAALDDLQDRRGLNFGTRPLCGVLRPRFVTLPQYRFLQRSVETLLPAFDAVYQKALVDTDFRRQFRLTEWEDDLLAIDPGFANPSPTARFDSFFVSEAELKFTEFNTETPAGAGYSDALTQVFHGLPVFRDFQRHYHAFPIPCVPGVTHALLDAFAQWQGTRTDKPRVAILDWREVPTFSEFILFFDEFRALGIDVRILDPRDVEYVDGKLMCGDYHINLIYKRVLITELIERGGVQHPVVQAVRDGNVCMVNTFRCKVLFKKASFAVVSDERNAAMFTPTQLQAVHAHIPWTRVVEERKTVLDGGPIDLVPFVMTNKDRFVLKPNDDYGGKGIVLGWTVGQAAWEAAVQAALTEPFVVQQKIRLPSEPFPSVTGGVLAVADRLLDTNPYVAFGTTVHGCLTRISTDELVNVTAGGGSTVPTFLLETR